MDKTIHDIRYALRAMRQAPGFAAIAVATLAIGIAANVTIFTVVNAVLLKSLPYEEPGQLIAIDETIPSQNLENAGVSYPNYLDWKKSIKEIQDIGVFSERSITLVTGEGGVRISGAEVSTNMFSLLGVAAATGRGFQEQDGLPSSDKVALISDVLWRNRFAADPNILGTVVKINGKPTTIIGVMLPRFRFPETGDIWIPVEGREVRGSHYLNAIGRMKPDITIEQAKAEMEGIRAQLVQQYPDVNEKIGIRVDPLQKVYSGDAGPLLWALLGSVVFVLLIAVANVANLLLSRSTVRQREISIRAALGAGRRRIIRQLLTESLMLSILGGAIGCLVSWWAVDALVGMIPEELPFFMHFAIDTRIIIFAFTITVLTGILFGLAPALSSSKPNLNDTLKETSPQSSGGRRRFLRNALITSEVSLALVLLIGSALMIESFFQIRRVQPGFDRTNLLVMDLSLSQAAYADRPARAVFYKRALDAVLSIPGVESASATSTLPLSGSADGTGITPEGRISDDPKDIPIANEQFIAPGYFRTMRIPLLRGRDFTDADNQTSSRVVIIDESMAKRFWPNEDPVGKRLKFGGPQSKEQWCTIVGVAGTVKHYGLREPTRVTTYIPYQQNNPSYLTYVIRSSNPQSLAGPIREAFRSIDAEQPLYNIRTMEEVVRSSFWEEGFFSEMFGAFAAIALVLAAVGIYGIVSYAVNQRVHEIGIRVALGAGGNDVLRLMVGQGMLPVALGIVIGIGLSLAVTEILSENFYGVSPRDPLTFVSISVALMAVAVAACYIPARRAMQVDPVVALRHE